MKLTRLRHRSEEESWDPDREDSDDELYELLAPERKRQLREMVAAMDRVCALIEQRRA